MWNVIFDHRSVRNTLRIATVTVPGRGRPARNRARGERESRDSTQKRASGTSPDRVRDREKLFQLGFLLQPAHIYHIGCISARMVRLRCSFGSSWPLVTHFRRKFKKLNYLAHTGKLTRTTSETPYWPEIAPEAVESVYIHSPRISNEPLDQ